MHRRRSKMVNSANYDCLTYNWLMSKRALRSLIKVEFKSKVCTKSTCSIQVVSYTNKHKAWFVRWVMTELNSTIPRRSSFPPLNTVTKWQMTRRGLWYKIITTYTKGTSSAFIPRVASLRCCQTLRVGFLFFRSRIRRREVEQWFGLRQDLQEVNRGLFPFATLLAISMVNWYFKLIKRGNQGYRRNAATGGYRSELILIAPINWSHGVTRTTDILLQSGATGLNKLTFTWPTLLNNALN